MGPVATAIAKEVWRTQHTNPRSITLFEFRKKLRLRPDQVKTEAQRPEMETLT